MAKSRPVREGRQPNYAADTEDDPHSVGDSDAESDFQAGQDEKPVPEEFASDQEDEDDTETAKRPKKRRKTDRDQGEAESSPADKGDADETDKNTRPSGNVLNLVPIPSIENPQANRAAYNAWAQGIVGSFGNHSEDNLPRELSFIYAPWVIPQYIERVLGADGQPVLCPHGRAEDKDYLIDIPWLPATVIALIPGWQLSILFNLGAPIKQIAMRIPSTDEVWTRKLKEPTTKQANAMKLTTEQADAKKPPKTRLDRVNRSLRKRRDDWEIAHGTLGRLEHRRAEKPTVHIKKVFASYHGTNCAPRPALSGIQLYWNCSWEIDSHRGTMRQPGARQSVPLYQGVYNKDFEAALVEWRTNRLNAPNFDRASMSREHPELFGGQKATSSHDRFLLPEPSKRRPGSGTNGGVSNSGNDDKERRRCLQCYHCPPLGSDDELLRDTGLEGPPPQPPLNPLGVQNDDTFWEEQWGGDQQLKWDEAAIGAVDAHKWPLNQQLTQQRRQAYYLPRYNAPPPPPLPGSNNNEGDDEEEEYPLGPVVIKPHLGKSRFGLSPSPDAEQPTGMAPVEGDSDIEPVVGEHTTDPWYGIVQARRELEDFGRGPSAAILREARAIRDSIIEFPRNKMAAKESSGPPLLRKRAAPMNDDAKDEAEQLDHIPLIAGRGEAHATKKSKSFHVAKQQTITHQVVGMTSPTLMKEQSSSSPIAAQNHTSPIVLDRLMAKAMHCTQIIEQATGKEINRQDADDISSQVWDDYQVEIGAIDRILPYSDNMMVPSTGQGYIEWASDIMVYAEDMDKSNPHPLLSYPYLPYARPDGRWARFWLPSTLDERSTPDYKVTLMYCLGASTMQVADRMATATATPKSIKTRLRKRIDDWRKKYGGLLFEREVQQGTKVSKSIFTGVFPEVHKGITKNRRVRAHLTPLQIMFNCVWGIDPGKGVIVQPISKGHVHRPNERYGGRTWWPLFKLQARPKEINTRMQTYGIAFPTFDALKLQHPRLFLGERGAHQAPATDGEDDESDNSAAEPQTPMDATTGALIDSRPVPSYAAMHGLPPAAYNQPPIYHGQLTAPTMHQSPQPSTSFYGLNSMAPASYLQHATAPKKQGLVELEGEDTDQYAGIAPDAVAAGLDEY